MRRSRLAVPASSELFIEKARGAPADEVFLDRRTRWRRPPGRRLGRTRSLVTGATITEAYVRATRVEARGAVMLGGEMIDEASRKMAGAIVARG